MREQFCRCNAAEGFFSSQLSKKKRKKKEEPNERALFTLIPNVRSDIFGAKKDAIAPCVYVCVCAVPAKKVKRGVYLYSQFKVNKLI